MKNLKNKLKKTRKIYRFTFYIIFLIYLASIIFLSRSLLLLSGIETLIRSLLITGLIIFTLFYLISGLVMILLKKNKMLVASLALVIIFSIINFVGAHYINETYNVIDNMNRDTLVYTTNLISLSDNKDVNRVGMIKTEDDIEGYILPEEFITQNKKEYEIEFFDTYNDLITAMYDGTVEAIFITNNYVVIYEDGFPNLKDDTKVLEEYSKKISNQDLSLGSGKSLTEPFTVLLIGVDSEKDGLNQNAAFNGDALMLISFNPNTQTAVMFGIPRDTFVPIACNNMKENKINSAAAYGTKCMVETIENLTDIDIDYYVKMNFKGVVNLVDAMDGIEVVVPKPETKTNYCLQNSNRELGKICLTPGLSKLNGEEALALARERDAFLTSDFKRVQNQQLILRGIIDKVKAIRNINDFYKIMDAITNNLDTNIHTKEMLNFYNVLKTMLFKNGNTNDEFITIERTYLTGSSLTINGYGYTFQYNEDSLNEITNAMKINLEIIKPNPIKTFSFSANKEFEEPVLGLVYSNDIRNEVLPSFINNTLSYFENWNQTRKINATIINEESNTCINNNILNQDIREGTLVSSIRHISLTVCKNFDIPQDEPITEDDTSDEETVTEDQH